MKSCKLGLHKWIYTTDGKGRTCGKCLKKQEKNVEGKWADSVLIKRPVDETKYCECPRDYTVSIKSMICPRCGLPRRPRIVPSGGNSPRPR